MTLVCDNLKLEVSKREEIVDRDNSLELQMIQCYWNIRLKRKGDGR